MVCASGNPLKKTHSLQNRLLNPEEKSGVLLWLLHLIVTLCQWGNEQVKFWGYLLVCRGVPCFGSRVPYSWVAINMKYQDIMLPLITATESETDIKPCWWPRRSHHNIACGMDVCDSHLSLSVFLMSSETRSPAEEQRQVLGTGDALKFEKAVKRQNEFIGSGQVNYRITWRSEYPIKNTVRIQLTSN